MSRSAICIDDKILTRIFKGSSHEFVNLATATQKAPLASGILDPPRSEYPLFEHLIIWLYGRWINSNISKSAMFGPMLSTSQKTNLGEALDYLIYSNFVPLNAEIGPRVSLLTLCYHEKFGFRDDPVLLQRMWYIRAFLLMEDDPNGAGPGERWKWYDHRLTLVIYSWVRHNRKYHGCPKVHCPCRQIIDLYGLSIGTFKTLYMNLEKQCVRQLQFVRSNEPVWTPAEGSKSLSRADDIKLYFIPNRKSWPHCFSTNVTEPDPATQTDLSPLTLVTPSNNSQTMPPSQISPTVQPNSTSMSSTLPPPHPSLPARPLLYPSSQPTPSSVQPQPPKDSPPPPPPARVAPPAAASFSSHHLHSTSIGITAGDPSSQPHRYTMPRASLPSEATSHSAAVASSGPAHSRSQTSIAGRDFPGILSTKPLAPNSSPSVVPSSPGKRMTPNIASRAINGTPGQQSVIPSAPRSMREVKGVNSGPVPTGPRALSGTIKPSIPTPNPGRSVVYAGVPSAPRKMRESLTKGNATSVNVNKAPGGQADEKDDNPSSPSKVGSDSMMIGNLTSSVTLPASNVADSDDPKSAVPNNDIARTAEEVGSASALQTAGKRSRSDVRAEESTANEEMLAKSKSPGQASTEGLDPSITLRQPQPLVGIWGPPSSPPAKRQKTLPEAEGTSKGGNKASAAKKGKDGAAILAAVSKQKIGSSVKTAVPAVGKAATRSRRGVSIGTSLAEGSVGSDQDIEMTDAARLSGTIYAVASEMATWAKSSPQTGKTPTSQGTDERNSKASSSVSPATTTKKTQSNPPITRHDNVVLNGGIGVVAPTMSNAKEILTITSQKSSAAETDVHTAASGTAQSAQAILQAAANKKAATGKLSASARRQLRTSKDSAPPAKTVPSLVERMKNARRSVTANVQMPVPGTSTEGSSSEDDAYHDENSSTDGDNFILIPIHHKNPPGSARKTTAQMYERIRVSTRRKIDPTPTSNSQAQMPADVLEEAVLEKGESASVEQKPLDEVPKPPSGSSSGFRLPHEKSKSREANKATASSRAIAPDKELPTQSDDAEDVPTQRHSKVDSTSQINTTTVQSVGLGSNPGARERRRGRAGSMSTRNSNKSGHERAISRTRKESEMQQEKSKTDVLPIRGKAKQGKSLTQSRSSQPEIIELSSDDSGVDDSKRAKLVIDLDAPNRSTATVLLDKNKVAKPPKAKQIVLTKGPVTDIVEVIAVLKNSPPFPTVLVQGVDSEKRMQQSAQEVRRLMCAMIAVGVPIEWWMVGITTNGFILRDEAAPLVIPSITEAILGQLDAIGIAVQVTPAELLSESEEEETPAPSTFHMKALPSPFQNVDSLPLVIFDGQSERRLRSQEAEERRLRTLINGLLRQSLVDLRVQINALDESSLEGVVCLVYSKNAPKLTPDQISLLGKGGLAIYRGETQLAGPLPVAEPSQSQVDSGTFDWRAMRKEVMNMKLPWEIMDTTRTPASASPYSPTAMTHSSSFTEQEASPADLHFRQLLRPNLWSGSGSLSKMAAAGMRWGEFSGVDPDSSDSSDEDMPESQNLGSVILA